jgi:hypothetical protein
MSWLKKDDLVHRLFVLGDHRGPPSPPRFPYHTETMNRTLMSCSSWTIPANQTWDGLRDCSDERRSTCIPAGSG